MHGGRSVSASLTMRVSEPVWAPVIQAPTGMLDQQTASVRRPDVRRVAGPA